jgi:hypothetical protein
MVPDAPQAVMVMATSANMRRPKSKINLFFIIFLVLQ